MEFGSARDEACSQRRESAKRMALTLQDVATIWYDMGLLGRAVYSIHLSGPPYEIAFMCDQEL